MKLLLVLGLCAIALATHREWHEIRRDNVEIRDTHFRTNRDYRYLYNAQVTTGLPETANQHAANRIQAEVSLVFPHNERTAVLRILRVRFGTTNRDLPEHREMQPFEVFETHEMKEEHRRLLELPLRFMYVDGLITDIEFDREDRPWSENIKRAILNMLQVNIKKNVREERMEERMDERRMDERRMDERRMEERRLFKETEDREMRDEMRENDFFRTHERTLEGDCETLYTFNRKEREDERERRDDRDMWKITKTINFEKCRERVEMRYNHRFAEECEECEEENRERDRATKTTTVFNYDVNRKDDKFLIEKVEVKSQYMFAPLHKEDNPAVTFVFNRLELVDVREKIEEHREPRTERKQHLMYSLEREMKIERFLMNGDEELDREHPFVMVKNKYELIEQIVLRMLQAMNDKELGIEHEAVHQMARLVDMLRMCNREEIRMVHERLYENTERFDEKKLEKVRDILVDALAIAGTKNTIEHLVEKIENRKLNTFKAVKALQNLVNVRVISEKHIDTVLRLCKKDVCERNPMLKQTCLLTVGGMINGLCRDSRDRLALEHREERLCPRELKEKYLKELMTVYRNAETRYEKTLALKTMANAGLDLMVFELEKIINDRKEERVIRNHAIDALRQLRDIMPRKIQRILMPIFRDRLEHAEIRMTALAHILHTIPNRAILDQIAHTLYNERNRQVQAFTLTMMRTFAESKIPCEKKMAEDLHVALRLARVHTEDWMESKYMHMPYYNYRHRTGVTLDLATIFTKDSLIPREMMLNLDTLFFGHWRKHMLQTGFVQYNLEQMLEKIIRHTENKNLEDIVVRGRRSTNMKPTDLLRELFERLHVQTRREETKVVFDVYLRRHNLDFALIPLDEETVPEMMKIMREGKIDLGRLEKLLGEGCHFHTHFATYLYEMTRRIPTTIGMPLVIVGKLPTVAGLEGEVKVEFTPKKLDKFDGLKAMIRVRPVVAATHIVQMYIFNPVVYSGIKMLQAGKINFPIDMNVDINMKDKMEVKYRIKVPEERKQIINMHTRAVTFTNRWVTEDRTYVEPKERTIHMHHHENRMRTINRNWEFFEKWMGVRFNIRGQYYEDPLVLFRRAPHEMMTTENAFEVIMERGRNAPHEIVAVFEFDITKENRMEKPEFDRFYEEKRDRELFEVDYEDEEEKDEKELEYRERRRNDWWERREEERRERDDDEDEENRLRENRRERNRMDEERMENRKDRRDEEDREERRTKEERRENRRDEERRMRDERRDDERRMREERREDERRVKDERFENRRDEERREEERRNIRRERDINEDEDDEMREWRRRDRENRERNEVERREQFTRYIKEYKLERGYKLRMHMRIEAVGAKTERKAEFEMHTMCDERIRYCKMRVNGRRTPMLEMEKREWTFKLEVETLYPEHLRTMKELRERKHREFNALMKCEWGTEKRYYLNVKMQGEQNHEQMLRLKELERMNVMERYDEMLLATQLNQYKMVVDYHMHRELREHIHRLFNLLKGVEMWNTKVIPVNNEEHKVFLKLTIDPRTQRYVNMWIETPHEAVEIKDLRLPMRIAPLMLNIRREEMPVRSITHLVRKTVADRRAECRVSTHKVNTFDDEELMMPITTCYSVLAKDCTSERPKFVVMMKKVRKDTEDKKMKIVDEDRIIEIERRENELMVKVDDRIIDDEDRLREMRIEKTEDMVVVELDDVLVRFDGRTAHIRMSTLYKNGQCGICGHYDDEREDELRKPDNMLTNDMEEFHRSYLNRDEECEIEEDVVRDKKNYRRLRDSYEDNEEDRDERREMENEEERRERKTRKPIMRTKMIEYNHELCFSMKPVAECPEDTYVDEENTVEKKVSFACLSRSKHDAWKLARRVRKNVVNMDKYKPSFVDTMHIPQTCLVF